MPFSVWRRVGGQISLIANASAWWLGDWLVYGEKEYKDRYRKAIENTSLDYQTLRNYAWIARHVPLSRRRDSLTFAHHAEVAALPPPEQDIWLRRAEQGGWTRNRLRRERSIKAALRGRESSSSRFADGSSPDEIRPKHADHEDAKDALQIHINPDRRESWERAAERQYRSVEEWALLVLDREAAAG